MHRILALAIVVALPAYGQTATATGRQVLSDLSTLKVKATGSTTARTLAARFGDTVNMLDYLPAGQPDGATDNSAGMQAAINAAPAGATVYMPPGSYRASGLTISSPINLVGAGNGRGVNPSAGAGQYVTEIVSNSQTANVITIAPVGSARLSGVTLRDFAVKGNRDLGGATTGHGIALASGSGQIESFRAYNVTSWRNKGDGWNVSGTVFRSDWYSCYGEENAAHGFDIASSNPSQLSLIGGSYSCNLGTGFYQAGTNTNSSIFGTTFALNATGIKILAGNTHTAGLLDIESNTTSGVEISTSGNELYGLNILAPGINSNVGIWVHAGASQNRYSATFGTFGTTPTHIKVDAGAGGPQWFFTQPAPASLTMSLQGVEIFESAPVWQNIDAAGVTLTLNGNIYPKSGTNYDLGAESTQRWRSLHANWLQIAGHQITYGTAAPTTGTWAVGDLTYNSTPSAGAATGWVCTSAGTPGTWAPLAVVADTGWIALTLVNSWVNFGGAFASAGYYKDAAGRVSLQGVIKSGTIGTAAFTLPAGYRPAATKLFPVNSAGAYGYVSVSSTGVVTPSAGNTSDVGLDSVSFRAEQ